MDQCCDKTNRLTTVEVEVEAEPTVTRFAPEAPPLHQATPQVAVRAPKPGRGRRRFGEWLNRSRRVLLTLAVVWVVNVFDLWFTVMQWGSAEFVELNPVAAKLLSGPDWALLTFKFGLLGSGTLILLALRRYLVTELACWLLLAIKLYLAIRWFAYFDCVVHSRFNPLVAAP